MFPTGVVHPVPVKLRRLVEGISSGPDDSREHRREQFGSLCQYAYVTLQPVFPEPSAGRFFFGSASAVWLELTTYNLLFYDKIHGFNDLDYGP